MPTPTERRIIEERRAAATGAVLVPLLEQLLEKQCEPEDDEDYRFLDMLVRVRAIPRAKGVFSPSMLGSCIRQAYFAKRGTDKIEVPATQRNGYFLHGNFVHFKWQFACWKAHRAGILTIPPVPAEHSQVDFYGDGTRPAVEVRVIGDSSDFGGTIDVIVEIDKFYVVDFKGVRLDTYMQTVRRGAPAEYRKQIVGYGKNVNESGLPFDIEECLLISESKSGPVSGVKSPLALHETRVPIADHEGEVARRLRTLRWFDGRDELPPPECKSTQHMQFQECPFAPFCREEVKSIQHEYEAKAKEKKRDWNVARSGR